MIRVQDFLSGESGAVTVDWVVLTAAAVGLGLATMAVVSGGTEDLSGDINQAMTDMEIASTFAPASPTVSGYDGQGASYYPNESIITDFYTMSDGSQWTRTVTTVNGVSSDPVWANGDGEVVEAPEGA